MKDSGYYYNPETFQTTNAKYEGDCFTAATISNNKDGIVFSTGCLPGDLPEAWIGVYNFVIAQTVNDCTGFNNLIPTAFACIGNQNPKPYINFLIGGSSGNFVWSQDDKTITYEADLGLSGMKEVRTIDAGTGEILEKKNNSGVEGLSLEGVPKLIYEAYKSGVGADYDLDGVVESIKKDELFFTDMIENPYDNAKLAILIKYKDSSKPHGVFIIDANKQVVENQYMLIGAIEHLYIENVKWNSNNELSFDSVMVDEGGVNKKSKILEVDETTSWGTYKNGI